MESFLQEFTDYYKDYRLVMIMDRAGWHNDDTVKQFDNLKIIKQPARSPEVNPAENLWEHIKENYFRNRLWKTLGDLSDKLCEVLKDLFEDRNTVKNLTGFHWIISHAW